MASPYQFQSTSPDLLAFMQALNTQGQGGGGNYVMPEAASNVEVDPILQLQQRGRIQGAQSERAARAQQGRDLEMLQAKAEMEANIRAQEQGFTAQQAQLDREASSSELQTRLAAEDRQRSLDRSAQEATAAKALRLQLDIQILEAKASQSSSERQQELIAQRDAKQQQLNKLQSDATAARAEAERSNDPSQRAFRTRYAQLKDQNEVHRKTTAAALAPTVEMIPSFIAEQLSSTQSGMGEFALGGVEGLVYGTALGLEGLAELLTGRDMANDAQIQQAIVGRNLNQGPLSAYLQVQPQAAKTGIGIRSLEEATNDPDGVAAQGWSTQFLTQLALRSLSASGQQINVANIRGGLVDLMADLAAATRDPSMSENPEKLSQRILERLGAMAQQGFTDGGGDFRPIIADILSGILEQSSTQLRASGSQLLSEQKGQVNIAAIQGGALMHTGDLANKMLYALRAALRGKIGTIDQMTEAEAAMAMVLAEGGQAAPTLEFLEGTSGRMVPGAADLTSQFQDVVAKGARVKELDAERTELQKLLAQEDEQFATVEQPRAELLRNAVILRGLEELQAKALADEKAARAKLDR